MASGVYEEAWGSFRNSWTGYQRAGLYSVEFILEEMNSHLHKARKRAEETQKKLAGEHTSMRVGKDKCGCKEGK